MLNLNGILSVDDVNAVREYTELRLSDYKSLKTPEALTLYEQNYIDREELHKLCEKEYGFELFKPITTYMPEEVIRDFENTGLVPVTNLPMENKVVAAYVPELPRKKVFSTNTYTIEEVPVTLYDYLRFYNNHYGAHPMLKRIPAKVILEFIVDEACKLGASDITLSTSGKGSSVYYEVRKKLRTSNRIFSAEEMDDIITWLTVKSPMDRSSYRPKYVDVDLSKQYRGRVVINHKFKGMAITMRLLPNAAFNQDINSLGLKPDTVDWLIDNVLDMESGLRLIVGETSAGKNTTALSLLKQVVELNRYKVVSVEMPVEQELPGVEQINCELLEEFDENIKSLIHQNPGFVYITETKDATAKSIMQITNTGKRVLSTLHANSVADVISRLQDCTGYDYDRIIQTLHSVVYQELVRDEETDTVRPYNCYVRFTDELKSKLYGKPLGEIIKIIKKEERGDVWVRTKYTKK